MSRSLGFAAYRAFSGRGGAAAFCPVADRPADALVWCHAPEPGSLLAIQDLASRLCRSRPGLSVLITVPLTSNAADLPQSGSAEVLIDVLPEDHPASVAAFLNHWQPEPVYLGLGPVAPEPDRRHGKAELSAVPDRCRQ